MSQKNLNKAEAGYRILQLLSAVDGSFSIDEDLIIRNYLVDNFKSKVNLDNAADELGYLKREDYPIHFQECMDAFYSESTPEERNHLLDFAVKLIKADEVITNKENVFLNMLYDQWDPQ